MKYALDLAFGRCLRKLASRNCKWLPGVIVTDRKKIIYLTFDDGPTAKVTPSLLDLLAKYQIKATFFINGPNLNNHADICLRIISEGHVLGNHTFSHCNLMEINPLLLNREVADFQKTIDEKVGPQDKIFRPTKGLIGLRTYLYLLKSGFKISYWNVDSGDSKHQDREFVLAMIKGFNGGSILFHDDNFTCVEVLEEIIPMWIRRGYRFETLRGGSN